MTLQEDLLQSAFPMPMPGGAVWRVLSPGETAALADIYRLTRREVELHALNMEIIPLRFVRNVRKYGVEGQIRLLESSAVVFGLEGLGIRSVEALASRGVGTLTLVDPVEETGSGSDYVRLATEAPSVRSRVVVAVNRALNLNSAIEVTGCEARLDAVSLEYLLQKADVALDCLPVRADRLRVSSACREHRVPVIHATISDSRGWVTTVFPEDEALEAIRPDIWPAEDKARPGKAMAAVAVCQGEEAVRVILKDPNLLRGQMLVVDAERSAVDVVPFDKL